MRLDEGVASVEVVGVDGGERFMDFVFGAPYGVCGAPGLFPFDGGHAAGEAVHALVAVFRFHQSFGVFADEVLELFGEAFPDDEYDFVESRLVVQDGFAAGSQRGDLFEASEAGAHARRHD